MENIDRIENVLSRIDRIGTSALDNVRMPKAYIRHEYNQDPYNLCDDQFKKRYRFTKNTVKNVILPLIADKLNHYDNRGLPITPEIQILIALRFYATGTYQTVCGDLLGLSQSTVCIIINKVSRALSQLLPQFIKFPNQLQNVKQKFEELGRTNQLHGLNNIIGAIDCTHIKINRPRGIAHSEAYRNRKSYFSVNVQAVVGPDMEIYDLVARWPGSAHDSRIFRNSRVHARLASGQLQGVLVGDSGYPSMPFILTPLIQPTTRAENNYNYVQIRTRNIIERFFGVWKKRFSCLQLGLRNKLTNVCNIIVACAVLHNIAIRSRDNYSIVEEDAQQIDEVQLNSRMSSAAGLAFRQSIVETYN